ncbi:Riboflavin biosynthesis protein RibBA [Candidatus Jidaibacter acanthamoeba]|uniref:3,4-dihydroxy-2-butanone 4-phosphate synthase n=1 Tax=Candidatus Jidaibacter acanthamoebae TaxID=86105 RepID=A0A0C1MZB4_9RICK|nr:bifunctional 3,4-dihydroxy-2-butanone-4-phosphate synthase/GTP cyclohydrolase II [Candidatus Jidaibacter acanthamoeba]KIE05396.1 Riboflavin biosynthesis protein RibBA [Candidatus Jidaibacter acanthamoeba]
MNRFKTISKALDSLKSGKMVVLVDDHDRENEGDLILAAQFVTPEAIAFMLKYTSGIICIPMHKERLDELGIKLMVNESENTSRNKTKFTTSVEARHGVSTGVSAQDRTTTIKALCNPESSARDISQPGHVFPLEYTPLGVIKRRGHTEGAIDLMRAANLNETAIICELMNEDGTMMRGTQINEFAAEHNMEIISIEDIYQYRIYHETIVSKEASATLPTEFGNFKISIFKTEIDDKEHIALTNLKENQSEALVRIHSSCTTGDIFHSLRCDCQKQLEYGLKEIGKNGGVLLYLDQEGRGIGLTSKIKAYLLQEKYNFTTVEANEELGFPVDSREYLIAAQIIKHFGITSVKLLSNNPKKVEGLIRNGVADVERQPVPVFINEHNKAYLETKEKVLGHILK